jgi:hypothetical protein
MPRSPRTRKGHTPCAYVDQFSVLDDAVDVAGVETPSATVSEDRGAFDRLAAEVLTDRAPDGFELLTRRRGRCGKLAAAPRSGQQSRYTR